jgi:Ni,Fe-hydrogenase III large subunit
VSLAPLVMDNAVAALLRDVPETGFDEFRGAVLDEVTGGGRIVALLGAPRSGGDLTLLVIVARPSRRLAVLSTVVGDGFPSMAGECPQLANFEREVAEQWGVRPEGHPWWKPLRYHASWRRGRDAWGRREGEPIDPSVAPFFAVSGEEVHEVAVGPVHAGIIEPGHFRFQCHGETVLHLEISLGYQHRGVERALLGGPDLRTIHYMETVTGDTAVGHALTYAHAVEALSECNPPGRAAADRAVALELERLANHVGDLGALAGDVGYLPTASYCGRIRGDFLNLTALVCGSRLGRGWIRPGGVVFDAAPHVDDMKARLQVAMRDLDRAVGLLLNTSTVRARFEETGILTAEICRELGLVGPPARACGIEQDVRRDFPTGAYRSSPVKVASWSTGDVFARAKLRFLETHESARFVRDQLERLPEGASRTEPGRLRPESIAVSLVEGWRGEICHVAMTDESGRFARYKIVDPSFHNWSGLAIAMRQQPISDFPLCNKSFNLSYCGHDL